MELIATITRNIGRNGIEIRFNDSTPYQLDSKLKNLGFRFSYRQKMWYAIYNEKLEDTLKTVLRTANVQIKGEQTLSDEQKKAIKLEDERKIENAQEQRKQGYLANENAKYADLTYLQFADKIRNGEITEIKLLAEITPYVWSNKSDSFEKLLKGRKRPDKYSISKVLSYIKNEAMKAGMVIGLQKYFDNPEDTQRDSRNYIQSINSMVQNYKQQTTAPDYDSFLAYHSERADKEKQLADRWEAYREKYVYDRGLLWRRQNGLRTAQVRIRKGISSFYRNDSVTTEYDQGWIINVGQTLINNLYYENPEERLDSQSILQMHPFEQFVADYYGQAEPPKHKLGDYLMLQNREGKFGFTIDEGDVAQVTQVLYSEGVYTYQLRWADGETDSFRGNKESYQPATKKQYENAVAFHKTKTDKTKQLALLKLKLKLQTQTLLLKQKAA